MKIYIVTDRCIPFMQEKNLGQFIVRFIVPLINSVHYSMRILYKTFKLSAVIDHVY